MKATPSPAEIARCGDCGLPLVECSALAVARYRCETYLKDAGYDGFRARTRAAELIPEAVRAIIEEGGDAKR